MSKDEILTDDYVADLLVKDANDCSLKYSTMGMEAYTSSSRPTSKFKPNTRFLRNIIKGTNRHNDALTAKELSESQARLKDLASAEEEKRKKYNPTANEIRGRQLGNIAALLGGKAGGGWQKRKRPGEVDDAAISDLRKARAAEDSRREADLKTAGGRPKEKRRRSMERYSVRRSKRRTDDDDDDDDDNDTYHRRNSSSDDNSQLNEDRRRRRQRSRSRSPKRSSRKRRHRSPINRKWRHGQDDKSASQTHHVRPQATEPSTATTYAHDDEADSDSLDDLIGPAPAPKVLPRGRGGFKGSSDMDSRFSSDYDPKSDIQMNEDTRDDWHDALEVLRDRAKMRQQGADRLRQAGFAEEHVKKWDANGERTIDDVQWTKKGEKREWDRGKNADQDDDE
ncbi:hypothetical protein BD289DRAFT_478716 [Coniella lustricola]|uniref:Pre-mRNA-splicing factor 38B n=1 Tax=Coniella lustricola TaxID=2025994 RepID=A0A2T3ALL2_9PEZI|nr:hypothetical protein BD289DRAFT_478716 [Coniella lustricola]